MDTSEFPPAPPAPESPENWLTVNTESFVDTFGRVALVASTDEARPVLTGVHMHIDDKGLNLQAADGFRLIRTCYTPVQHSKSFECLVPWRIGKLLGKLASATVHLAIDPSRNVLHITGDNEHICSQLVDGAYPDLNQVIPVKPQHRVSFLADAAAEALAPFKANMGILRVAYADGALSLAIRSSDHDIETTLACTLESELRADMTGYNPDLLKGIIQATQRKGQDVKVVMENTIPTCPAKFTTPDSDPDFVAVLMPMFIYD
jgi:DNA polymerase-3 subunit beta